VRLSAWSRIRILDFWRLRDARWFCVWGNGILLNGDRWCGSRCGPGEFGPLGFGWREGALKFRRQIAVDRCWRFSTSEEKGLLRAPLADDSFRTPSRNSRPSLRQFLATAENCSRCHFTVRREPTWMGVLTRMQAPDGEVSSRVAEARFGVPPWSSQKTSATAHKTVLGSMLRPSMPCVSAVKRAGFSYVGAEGECSHNSSCAEAEQPSFARTVRV
jgi:hypothetical protein